MLMCQQKSASVFKFQITKKREYSHRTNRKAVLPFCVYEKCAKLNLFPFILARSKAQGEIIKAPLKKPIQKIILPLLHPYSRSFWSVWKGNGDRPLKPPENSVCTRGRSKYKFCYTAACHSPRGRRTIPDAIFCSGS